MTTYFINFADPLRNRFPTASPYGDRIYAFSIAPGGFDGPGGSVSSSNLRLYGRGALEWGEAVDEDLLRLAENFSGSTPPPFATGGQLWLQTRLYFKTPTVWYRFNLETSTPGNSMWDVLPQVPSPGSGVGIVSGGVGPGTGSNVPPAVPVAGSYWFTGAGPFGLIVDAFGNPIVANTLYRYDQPFRQMPVGWIERVRTEDTVAPTIATNPQRSLLYWAEFEQGWASAPVSIVAPTAPTPGTIGGFWFNTTDGQPYVFDGTTWDQIVTVPFANGATGYVQKTGDTMSGILSMGGNRITNVTDPAAAQDAMTLAYADANYVNTAGDTMTGPLILSGDPILALGAATKQYVDNSLAGSGFSTVRVPPYVGAYNTGDIYVDSGVIYIATAAGVGAPPGGNWAQVFPAQYS